MAVLLAWAQVGALTASLYEESAHTKQRRQQMLRASEQRILLALETTAMRQAKPATAMLALTYLKCRHNRVRLGN